MGLFSVDILFRRQLVQRSNSLFEGPTFDPMTLANLYDLGIYFE